MLSPSLLAVVAVVSLLGTARAGVLFPRSCDLKYDDRYERMVQKGIDAGKDKFGFCLGDNIKTLKEIIEESFPCQERSEDALCAAKNFDAVCTTNDAWMYFLVGWTLAWGCYQGCTCIMETSVRRPEQLLRVPLCVVNLSWRSRSKLTWFLPAASTLRG